MKNLKRWIFICRHTFMPRASDVKNPIIEISKKENRVVQIVLQIGASTRAADSSQKWEKLFSTSIAFAPTCIPTHLLHSNILP